MRSTPIKTKYQKFPDLIKDIQKYGIEAQGRDFLIMFARGERLSPKQRCVAMCYKCQGFYADGKADCQNIECPLYPYMPYQEKR